MKLPSLAELAQHSYQPLLERFASLRITVWGDFVADEFIHGEISRVSREAPVLILKQRAAEIVPGGAGNAALNLAALGVQVELVGAVGTDAQGEALVKQFERAGVRTNGVLRLASYQTPTKSRVMAGHTHTTRQQVVRVDREPQPLSRSRQERLAKTALRLARGSQALLVSDYGYGAVTPESYAEFRKHHSKAGLVTLDARYQLAAYREISAATPNEAEVEEVFHERIGQDAARLERLGSKLRKRLGCEWLLVTRGRDGMALFHDQLRTLHLPVLGSDQAVDVTGAGDTVIAVFTAALAAGASGAEAAWLANCAGGIVVMKRGTATVSQRELRGAVLNGASGRRT